MPKPCSGPQASVLRTRMSSVPCSSPTVDLGGMTCSLSVTKGDDYYPSISCARGSWIGDRGGVVCARTGHAVNSSVIVDFDVEQYFGRFPPATADHGVLVIQFRSTCPQLILNDAHQRKAVGILAASITLTAATEEPDGRDLASLGGMQRAG